MQKWTIRDAKERERKNDDDDEVEEAAQRFLSNSQTYIQEKRTKKEMII